MLKEVRALKEVGAGVGWGERSCSDSGGAGGGGLASGDSSEMHPACQGGSRVGMVPIAIYTRAYTRKEYLGCVYLGRVGSEKLRVCHFQGELTY